MADMVLGSAQGAVDSLLGRLTSVLLEEGKLLGGVRSDVQFIKDEMESMNGFLMHVADATGDDNEDHQIRAWMKQVAEVAYASQNSINLYVHSLGVGMGRREPGFLGYLRRLPKLVWTLPTRHRIATQIRELKIRSCEVGERRMRYDVRAPDRGNRHAKGKSESRWAASGDDDAKDQEDARRRSLADSHLSDNYRGALLKWLTDEEDTHGDKHKLRVMVITGMASMGKTYIAQSAYQDPFAVSSFDWTAWVHVDQRPCVKTLFRDIVSQAAGVAHQSDIDDPEVLVNNLRLHLEGKRFLLVLDDVWDLTVLNIISAAVLGGNFCSGSAILVTTRVQSLASSVHYPKANCSKLIFGGSGNYSDYVMNKAISLLDSNKKGVDLRPILRDIIGRLCYPFDIRLFLRDLYVNPNQNEDVLQSLLDRLRNEDFGWNNRGPVLMHVYSKLPSDCKNCLLYLSILPENTTFTRARLLRRWDAEGMITKRGRLGALDQAERYFDLLVAHELVWPIDISATGKVKTFTVHDLIYDFVMEIARGENLSNANLQPDLAHRLSIRNEVQLQLAENNATRSKASCWNICNHFKENDQTQIDHSNSTEVFLESLSSSATQLGIVEVLDLEDCKQLKDYHLKNICSHVFQLKYLSLRNTDITELPKQLDKLLYLETLDIRQTNVRAFAKNSVFLPRLKYLLAGHRTDCTSQGNNNSEETFFTVQIPKHVGGMTEMQVLSYIAVSGNGDELIYIGNLLRLRKLGLVLNGCDGSVFRHLYHTIGNLSRCLRSLSIQATRLTPSEENSGMEAEGVPPIPPKHLQKLEISGLESGLPPWIEKLAVLTKITLHKTFLTTGDISILGKLASLCFLRLRQESCSESILTLKTKEFQSLNFLILECSDMSNINFGNEASPKLKKIVWTSTEKQSLAGIEHLPRLEEIELTKGKFDLKKMKEEITRHQNNPVLKIKWIRTLHMKK